MKMLSPIHVPCAPCAVFLVVSVLATLAGAQVGKLSGPLGPGRDVIQFAISPDGARAVYRADADRDEVFELYSVTTGGTGAPVKLHAALPSGRTVFGFLLDPYGARVVYHSNPVSSGKIELFSVPADASLAPVRLNGPFSVVTGGVQTIALFGEPLYAVTPDGARVVFVAVMDVGVQADIYSAPIDGSTPAIKLNPTFGLVGGKSVSTVSHFRISADGSRVVYEAVQDTDGVVELYSVPVDGSSPSVKLNGALVTDGDVVTDAFAIAADSTRVVYLADQDSDRVNELYSAPLDGSSTALKINAPLTSGGEVLRDFALAPDGTRVLYRADQDVDGAVQLYSVPLDGSQAPVALGGSSTSGRTVMHFAISPDGSRVAYCADQDSFHLLAPFSAPVDGSAPATALATLLPPDADVFPEMRFTPDSNEILFVADAEQNQRFDLFAVPVDGSALPRRLSAAVSHADVRAWRLTPDGTRVVLLADAELDEVPELYQVGIVGGAMQKVCPTLPAGREVLSRFVSRDDGVFYLSDKAQDDVFELFRMVRPGTRSSPPPGSASRPSGP